MSILSRSVSLAVLALSFGAAGLHAQQGSAPFTWSIGPQAGAIIFGTQQESRGALASAGGQVLITAHRAGLMLSFDEGFGSTRTSTFYANTTPAADTPNLTPVTVQFGDVRRYAATLVAFPFKRAALTPYLGVGFGVLQAVNPKVQTAADQAQKTTYEGYAREISGGTFGSLLAGVQFHVGGLSMFGQYQLSTTPSSRDLRTNDAPSGDLIATGQFINTATHMFVGGFRISLGSAREDIAARGN